MKKMLVIVAVVAMAVAACGKKKDAAAPTAPEPAAELGGAGRGWRGLETAPAERRGAGRGACDRLTC